MCNYMFMFVVVVFFLAAIYLSANVIEYYYAY